MPGDCFHIANEVVIRFHNPLFAPLLHEVNVFVHYFFVPYRILWHDDYFWPGHEAKHQNSYSSGSWERYIMANEDGSESTGHPQVVGAEASTAFPKVIGGSFDFLYGVYGFGPLDLAKGDGISYFPLLAYQRIWNEFYRDENLQDELTVQTQYPSYLHVNGILRRNWEKDYFTSSLPFRQRGIMPALPGSSITANAVFDGLEGNVSPGGYVIQTPSLSSYSSFAGFAPTVTTPNTFWKDWLNQNHVEVSGLFNVEDLRLTMQLQHFFERSARGGVRYTEFLKSHHGVSPRDDRLDRPEYIGGTKAPVIFSEVLKTSQEAASADTDPQGHLAGHGLSASREYAAKYHVQEFGVIMGLLSVMPRTAYMQGVDRQWKRRSRYEYAFPEFMHLTEQAVYEEEIMLHESSAGTNTDIFGYQGRYDEYRQRRSTIHGNLRDTLKIWHLARVFSTTVSERPILTGQFVSTADVRDDIYSVQSDPGFIVNIGNIIKAVRPMPVMSEPGLMDHF
jgi:hypothetical protein